MRIGIIGSGKIGATAARLLIGAGHEIAISNSRGPSSLAKLVGMLGEGARAASVEQAAAFGDTVLVAIPMLAYTDLPARALAGKVVIDATNYYSARDGRIAPLEDGGTTSSELLAGRLQDASIVKSFNTMYFRRLAEAGRPDAPREQRLVLFVAGDDAAAKGRVAELIEQIGFTAVDTGTLADGAWQQPGAPLYNRPMQLAEAESALATLRR